MPVGFLRTSNSNEVSTIANIVWREYYSSIFSKEYLDYIIDLFQSESAIKEQMDNGYIYTFIKVGEEKVGYYALKMNGDDLRIYKFYIRKEYRGKGIGSKAFNEMVSFAKSQNMRTISLNVYKGNFSAIQMYSSKGFKMKCKESTSIGKGYILDDFVMEYVVK